MQCILSLFESKTKQLYSSELLFYKRLWCRAFVSLYYIEEKKYEDICEIMNMNYQSVRNLMHRGLTKLRSLAS